MCVCDIGGVDDLFNMRVRHAVGDIVEDGVREHHRFLLNIADAAAVILQVDIADIDVGRNIGAQLQSLQAEADKNIAQAKAEERRAMAVAREQEMRAYVVEAEAEVPKAMAYALREGKLGVMDYYELQNLKADTAMRLSLIHI